MTNTIPTEKSALREALRTQREYTMALYRGLPEAYWTPADFPFSALTNPPLWELSHIAYFAEFFCVRWSPDDVLGAQTPSLLAGADELFNSTWVPHAARRTNTYPSKAQCFDYMAASLRRVLALLEADDGRRLSLFQLALLHEDMHAEALLMTLRVLNLPLPEMTPVMPKHAAALLDAGTIDFDGGEIWLGAGDRAFRFDNEMPPMPVTVAPFAIDALPVSAAAFAAWRGGHAVPAVLLDDVAAMHVSFDEASAFARDHGRRLPTEAEWEFAATAGGKLSARFLRSTGHAWEWTATAFAPRPGFAAGAYADYSAPWFAPPGKTHMVLKGGSFATHPRLKYPQYRNFYTPDRCDMFCGFRTCAN